MFLHFLKRGGLVAAVLLVVAAMLGAVWWAESATARALAERGVPAVATVTDMRTRTAPPGRGTRTSHEIAYAYEALDAEGRLQPITVRHAVPRRVHDALALGDEVTIRYLPEAPAHAEVYPGEAAAGATLLGAFALLVLTAATLSARIAFARRATGAESRRQARASRRAVLI